MNSTNIDKFFSLTPLESIGGALHKHAQLVLRWSSDISLLGSEKPFSIENTIPLTMHETNRKFTDSRGEGRGLTESDILFDDEDYILIGGPGSGKTTTLKRLANLVLNRKLKKSEVFKSIVYLDMRNYEKYQSLLDMFISTLNGSLTKGNENDFSKTLFEAIKNNKLLFLIDGIDVVSTNRFESLVSEITDLSSSLFKSKFVVTCRSGYFYPRWEGKIVEIAPLSDSEISKISGNVFDRSQEFIQSLDKMTYSDTAQSPLILVQMLMIYLRIGGLPKRSVDLYRLVIELLLESWDRQRVIKRSGTLSSERKLDFLSYLAYFMITNNFSVISSSKLLDGVKQYAYNLGIDENEILILIDELISSTGLLVHVSSDVISFSHLSYQEYLAAYYLVRFPLFPDSKILLNMPASLAIATALSSHSEMYFNELLKHLLENGEEKEVEECLRIMFSRLSYELPEFPVADIVNRNEYIASNINVSSLLG